MEEDNFREQCLADWKQSLIEIFSSGIPASAQWTDIQEMGKVLATVGSRQNSNHVFFPTGGGRDLDGAEIYSEEPGCLALKFGERAREVVKPTVLLFESFGDDLQWAYFRLECEPLPQSGAHDTHQGDSEEVVLVSPGEQYAPRSAWDEDEHEGKRLPPTALLIVRSTGGGPLVIFSKGSTYNFTRSANTYDARHAKVDAATFRSYISKQTQG